MSDDPMAEIRASFFVECEELLENLQDALAVMDNQDHDDETINVVFRAVHSIKGGAGAFGLDALVGFAHRFETVLDELRSGRLELTHDAMKLFFQGADLLQDQVSAARDGDEPPEGSEPVLKALEALLGEGAIASEAEEEVAFTPMGIGFDLDLPGEDDTPVSNDSGATMSLPGINTDDASLDGSLWDVEFKPHADLYSSGNEAALLLRALNSLGECQTRCLVPDDLADASPETAEQPVLAWRVQLRGDVDKDDILQLFDFVADVCDLAISGPLKDGEQLEVSTHDAHVLASEVELVASVHETSPSAETSSGAPESPSVEAVSNIENADNAGGAKSDIGTPKTDMSNTPVPAAAAKPVPKAVAKVNKPTAKSAGGNEGAGATVRVDLEKIDRLVNLVGELVINQAMLSQSVEEAGISSNTAVTNGLESFMMLTRDIQDSVMMIRAQPVKPLFQRMGRIVREASASVGKEVRLKTEGDYTEVDKTVIERLSDPLTHMIRNAVDHGLEAPKDREAAGKAPEGVITLSASHRAGRVLIEIQDDGAGINRPKVRDIAVSKGLIPADAQLSDSEIDNLLFLPGFSTASQVSALSGRGVGMDVVKSAITSLGGRVHITSKPGEGTTFTISLPLTLAVLDGMVVRAAGQTLVVPLSAIIETATLVGADIQRLGSSGELMQIRDDFVPLFDLAEQLGFREKRHPKDDGIVLLTSQDSGKRTALIVDAIMEQRQVVIKGLSQSYGNVPGVAAATILGDGQIALILDPADLAETGQRPQISTEIAAAG